MKIKIFLLSLIVGTVNMASANFSRVNMDGTISFPVATINDTVPLWTQADKDAAVAAASIFSGTSPVTISNYTPPTYLLNLSTTLVISLDGQIEEGFSNYTEWISCQTRAGLKRKIRKIRQLIDSMSDLPASETRELRERAGWVRSYYNSLP